jgi:hypothetical protein
VLVTRSITFEVISNMMFVVRFIGFLGLLPRILVIFAHAWSGGARIIVWASLITFILEGRSGLGTGPGRKIRSDLVLEANGNSYGTWCIGREAESRRPPTFTGMRFSIILDI